MMNTSELSCPNRKRPVKFGHLAVESNAFTERIVNIAGIGYGDAVVCLGDTGTAIEAAASASGARSFTATVAAVTKGRVNALRSRCCADAVLCATTLIRGRGPVESVQWARRNLRSGGRLVMWTVPDRGHAASVIADRLQRMLRAAGFTSIIAGQLPPDVGGTVVVTGILILDS